MKTLNPVYLPMTPQGAFNFVGAVNRYFNQINGSYTVETIEAYIDYYNKNIFPYIEYGKQVEEYTVEYVEDLISRIQEENEYQYSTIRSTIRHLIYDPCVCFFEEFYPEKSEFKLTPSDWHMKEGEKADESIQLRIIKSLSVKEEKRAFKVLFEDPETDTGEYIALATQLFTALRLNEVCGANYGDIIEMFDHKDCYYIQITKSTNIYENTLKAGGKTYNAYRRIPLVNVLKEFLLKRIDYLANKLTFPYTYDGIVYQTVYELPLACRGKEYGLRCSSHNLGDVGSEFLRKKVGLTKEEAAGVVFAYYQDRGSEYDLGEKSPTTYLLRRNLATHLYTLGFSIVESQYLMGHKMENTDLKRSDFGDEEFLYSLWKKLQLHPLNQIKQKTITVDKHVELHNAYATELLLKPGDYSISLLNKEYGDILQIETRKSVLDFEAEERRKSSTGNKEINIVNEIRKAYKKTGDKLY